MLFDLSDLPHGLLEDGTFVRLDVEAVDVGEVGRDELSQLLDVLALLFPPTLVTPAGSAKGIRRVAMTTSPPHAPSVRPWVQAGSHTKKSSAQSGSFRGSQSAHPKPGVSQVDSLRLRSAHSGSNRLSPTPLIFSAYQHLKAQSCILHIDVNTHI